MPAQRPPGQDLSTLAGLDDLAYLHAQAEEAERRAPKARPRPNGKHQAPGPGQHPVASTDEERQLVDALQSLPPSAFKSRLQIAYGLVQSTDRRVVELSDALATESDPQRLTQLLAEFERLTGHLPPSGTVIERLGAQLLTEISTAPPPPMLIDRLDPAGHTILFGTGGVGKGTLSASWIVQLLTLDRRVLIVDYENHPDEWARRIHGLGARSEMDRVLHVAPMTAAWKGKRGAIWQQAEDLRALAEDFAADYVLVDSIVPACAGSDPLKPEAVSQYAAALELIGRPTLSLAHVTKADDLRYPFGSIFWHNLSRTTWSLKNDGGTVVLTHRKHNNYAHQPPAKVEVQWNADGMPVDLWERSYHEDLARRISQVLSGRSMSVEEICLALDELNDDDEAEPIKADTVSKALRRGSRGLTAKFKKDGRKWRNAA